MLGAIIGDIVGSRFEFNNHRDPNFELFHPECTFTDDTICTIAVADWLMNSNEGSLADIMRQWCKRYPSSYGGMFGRWIHDESMGPYNSFGNGSAMRASPVGWLGDRNLEDVMTYAIRSAAITHDHPEGIKGSECIAYAIWHLRHGFNKTWVKEMAYTNYGYYLGPSCASIRQRNTFNETCQVTVPQAITCFLESTDFESAIRLAVSIGGDSDTIAAITGSLAEAYYGVPEWMKKEAMAYLPEDMVRTVNQFYSRIQNISHE